ncbi:PKD domain-containing protein [Massilia rubra]|uniref:Excalibur calcium-binding domain-containing protein n=1 Tax=Massilia rubra TaxID=2607910 RepID=A0ABX0LWL4_9BURK|nr:PKD domain-containing protein [Massilia rubra]NHZ36720.1 excalibur calcium-binding domain-containing protein [Massilia rubra]
MKNHIQTGLLSFAILALTACGGGSNNQPAADAGGSIPAPAVVPIVAPVVAPVIVPVVTPAPVNAAPIGNAGADQNVFVGAAVIVDGGASNDPNGDSLTYTWTLSTRPASSNAAFASVTTVAPRFNADVAGIYIATLVVNDGKVDGVPVTATIIASEKQISANAIPVANAGANQTAPVGTKVTLNGEASSDKNGDALKHTWTLVSKPPGSNTSVIGDGNVRPVLLLDAAGTYSVTLVVNDGKADSLPATVLITAVAPPTPQNIAPTANAGKDQTVNAGSMVYLDGTSSTDANGDKLTYAWSITAKPANSSSQMTTPTLAQPQFLADATGIYEVTLSVSDGKAASATKDTITIIAKLANTITVADNGTYRCGSITKQRALALYAEGHTYLDRDNDGKPCEANDIANEITSPYVAPIPSSSGQCYVSGYYRKNGTYVKGYYRRCPS